MNEYKIVAWDHLVDETRSEADLEQYVPAEVEELARQVMTNYDMTVSQMTLITSKPDKGGAIWRIETNHGPRSIKVLHRQPERSLFSVGAQQYLVEKGARVPALIATKSNELHVVAGGKMWIVTEWITPLEQLLKIDLEGAAPLCKGLGEFHNYTKGYTPPTGSAKSSRIYRWEKHYDKILKKIGWFRDIATSYSETAASPLLISIIDKFEEQAKDILAKFQQSPYKRMVNKGEPYWGLAHQDYGWSNGQLGPDGIWVIDLDGVAYDLPIRDLRKIITSTMDDMGVWDINWIRGVIAAYNEGNPLDQETFELLWLDMAFPNEFYKHVKEIVFDPTTFMNTELEPIINRILLTETNKWQVLEELALDKASYPVGDYPEEVEEIRQFSNMDATFDVVPLNTDETAIPLYTEIPAAPAIPIYSDSDGNRTDEPIAAETNDEAIAKLIEDDAIPASLVAPTVPTVVTIPNNVIPFLVDKAQPIKRKRIRSKQPSKRTNSLKTRRQAQMKRSRTIKHVKAVKKARTFRPIKAVRSIRVVKRAKATKLTQLKKNQRLLASKQKLQRKLTQRKKVISRKASIWIAPKKGVYYKKRIG